MSVFGKCALQWPKGFSVVLSSFSSCEHSRLCRLKPLCQANDDCIISKQLITFSFILTGSWLFLRFYTLWFFPLACLSLEQQTLLCISRLLNTSFQGSKDRQYSICILLGIVINKISIWVPEKDGFLMHKEFPGVGLCSLYILTLPHVDSAMFSGSRLQQQKQKKQQDWQNSNNVFGFLKLFQFLE